MDIRSVIKQKGYTIEQVADMMGISRVTLMQNISRNPTISTLRRVADALDCKISDFFQDELSGEDKNSIICPKCGAKFTLKE
jgi:transcriptional regulator with XRE-family HTH domain